MSLWAGICQKYSYLTIFYPSGCATVLSFHANRVFSLLEKTRFVYYKYAILLAQMLTYITSQLVPHSVCIPTASI